jgi:hypothetical protein
VVAFARALVGRRPCPHRLARAAAVFSFVTRLMDRDEPSRHDAIVHLLWLVGRERGAAVIVAALLMALGERTRIECTRELAFVCLVLDARELALLPPHARVRAEGDRVQLPLDARGGHQALGFLPAPVCEVLARRRGLRLLKSNR